MRIRTDDEVVVISGKDKGKTGEVSQVLPKDNAAVVKGINVVTRHLKPSMANPPDSAWRSESIVPQTEWVCKTAPASSPRRAVAAR